MIRSTPVLVAWPLWQQVRALAELRDVPPEALLETWIAEKLEATPEIAELVKMRHDAKKRADAEWKAKCPKVTL